MIWKKLFIVVTIPLLQNNLLTINSTKQQHIFPKELFKNRDERFLKLSRALEENKKLKLNKKNFLKDETDQKLLEDVEKLFFIPANHDKVINLNNLVTIDPFFGSFDELSSGIKNNSYVRDISRNKYFLRYKNIDLKAMMDKIENQTTEIIEEIKTVILEFYNFLTKIIDVETTCKLILNLFVSNKNLGKNTTTLFKKIGVIAILFEKNWWSKLLYTSNGWTTVEKNGATFVHELAHAIADFTRYPINQHILINSTNIEKIIDNKNKNYGKIEVPIKRSQLLKISKELNNEPNFANDNLPLSVAPKFADYIFKKVITQLNLNKNPKENSYSNLQPIHRFLMLICALIPSNYARKAIIESNIHEFQIKGCQELWAEAFSFLLFADENEKNIFWEWTYDFIVEEQNLKKYFVKNI